MASSSSLTQTSEHDDDDYDYARYMRDSSPVPAPPSSDDDPAAAADAGEPDSPTPSGDNPAGHSLQGSLTSRNELAAMRRTAERMKLTPYQKSDAEEFFKVTPFGQHNKLFLHILRLENKLDALVTAAPPFCISPALHLNVKSFIMGVLLSSKLNAYKGQVPRKHVWALFMKDHLHLPPHFQRDPHAGAVLKAEVTEELIQARSKLKKAIAAHKLLNIYDLAAEMISGTQCTVTIPLCARVALLRKVYLKSPSTNFWDAVDQQLKRIRATANDDPILISRAFAGLLRADRDLNGGDPSDIESSAGTTSAGDIWQQDIDNLIQA